MNLLKCVKINKIDIPKFYRARSLVVSDLRSGSSPAVLAMRRGELSAAIRISQNSQEKTFAEGLQLY